MTYAVLGEGRPSGQGSDLIALIGSRRHLMTLKQALLGATVLAVLPMAAQAQTTTTRRSTTTTPTTQYVAPTAAPAATYAPAPVVAPVPAYNRNIISGLYISGGIGGDMALNSNASGIQTQYKAGYVGVAAIGYGFGNGFRAEVEANFRQNAIDKVKFASVTQGGSGYLNNWAGMVNGLYDFDIGGPITPYVGVGVGMGQVGIDPGQLDRVQVADRLRQPGTLLPIGAQAGHAGIHFEVHRHGPAAAVGQVLAKQGLAQGAERGHQLGLQAVA
jgi:opacity protein-like surface antigen